ncbi:MAG: hypothetical protein J4F48_07065 [Nitrospinae bacterium]|nr:hypothetical protein [Nitrospinota bacterium]
MDDSVWNRLGLICSLAEKCKGKAGRTALMKFAYFLKELKGVPLAYRFTLHTYGPFDSQVLDDLSYAEALEGVEGILVPFPGGYGYEYTIGPKGEELKQHAQNFLGAYDEAISLVVGEFGSKTAGELEMISTIIFVDRSAKERESSNSIDELSNKVVGVKPHLELDVVRNEVESLHEREYLLAVDAQ